MSLPRAPLTVAAATAALLTVSVVVAPSGPASAGSLPPVASVPLEVRDASAVAEHRTAGITLTPGWEPTGVFTDADPWELLDPVDGVRPWVEALPRLRLAYDPDGRLLVEDAVVVRDPARCYHVARTVRRVGVGLPPPAGPAIAQTLEGWLAPPYFSAVRPPAGSGPCTGRDRAAWGFAIEQVEPLPCHVPGRDVLCATVAKWRYDFGVRDAWTSAHLVFDADDGAPLGDDELHPDLDVAAFDRLLDDVLCAAGGRCDGVPIREGRVHPTRAALVIELSPGEGAEPHHGSLRVTVPRRSLPTRTDGGR